MIGHSRFAARAHSTCWRLATLGCALAGTCFGTTAHAQEAAACAALRAVTLAGMALEITSAARVPAGVATPAGGGAPGYTGLLPAHCRVEGVIERRHGVGGVEYGIRFALALPDSWTGRFLFQGGGGLNGSVNPPLGAAAAGSTPALARGFAVVSTDTGHQGAVFDRSFFADQEATLNFLYVANGKVAQVAKRLIDAYYRKPAERSYFVGCSTGGREAMIMSQRYPTYFDGIVAGAPAMRTGYSNLGMRSVAVALGAVAQRDANGAVIPGSALSATDKKLIVDSALAVCDAQDGLADGMLFDPLACRFDPATLACRGAKNDRCLTPAQVNAVKGAMAGPRTVTGRPVYPGYLYDTGIGASGAGTIPGVLNGAAGPVGPRVPPATQDIDAEAAAVAGEPSTLGDTNQWTNLSTFTGHGGKLLFYHGVSDPWFSALDTVEYYRKLGTANGGEQAVRDWSRLFLVPGMGHCRGGEATLDEFDLLTAVVEWVEHGHAPEAVTATGAAFPGRSRPLCAFPQHAHYKGAGNPEDAANFECR
ncbi:MAG TPA: tannase/feruloyl esterase family alpha/beta hydrolase [Gammaproteobacteria bacterium]|nr:tannase/feruloyl esterase family alpha/beta hydrolase [Gammaproteobacteria bacterium]